MATIAVPPPPLITRIRKLKKILLEISLISLHEGAKNKDWIGLEREREEIKKKKKV